MTDVPIAETISEAAAQPVAAPTAAFTNPPALAVEPVPAVAPVFFSANSAPDRVTAPVYAPPVGAMPEKKSLGTWKTVGIVVIAAAVLLVCTTVFFAVKWSQGKSEISDYKNRYENAQDENSTLQTELDDLQTSTSDLETDIADRDSQITSLEEQLAALEAQTTGNADELAYLYEFKDFIDANVVFIAVDLDTQYYHKYDCETFQNCSQFLAFNENSAIDMGYTACPICFGY